MSEFSIFSPDFEDGGEIPKKFGYKFENEEPNIKIKDQYPTGSVAAALIMDDPDVPKNLRADGMWNHWIVFNISPETLEIPEGVEPEGMHGKGTSGNKKYHGPCPPDKEHRYFFKLYALNITLDLAEGATKIDVERAMKGYIVDQIDLVGLYERTKE